jgi:hypothetical protein
VLHTEQEGAELLYVTNGRRLLPTVKITGGGARSRASLALNGGYGGNGARLSLFGGRAKKWDTGGISPEGRSLIEEAQGEDYPEYDPPSYEPKFYEYVEKTLAAKLAMKITEQPQLQTTMLGEAMLLKTEATEASLSSSAAKRKSRPWLKETLGLSTPERY